MKNSLGCRINLITAKRAGVGPSLFNSVEALFAAFGAFVVFSAVVGLKQIFQTGFIVRKVPSKVFNCIFRLCHLYKYIPPYLYPITISPCC